MPISSMNDLLDDSPVSPIPANDTPTAGVAALDDQAIEGGFDPVFGGLARQMLISGDNAAAHGFGANSVSEIEHQFTA